MKGNKKGQSVWSVAFFVFVILIVVTLLQLSSYLKSEVFCEDNGWTGYDPGADKCFYEYPTGEYCYGYVKESVERVCG